MKRKVRFIFYIFLIISSCSPITKSILGVKEIKPISDDELIYYSKKNKISNEASYSIDTTMFCSSFANNKELINNENALQDIIQPLQIRMFKYNELIFFHANCYADGGLKLNWNKYNSFNSYPPSDSLKIEVSGKKYKTIFNSIRNYQLKNNQSIITLESSLETLNPIFKQNFNSENEFVIMVYWSIFLNKQSKKLIQYITKYTHQHKDKKITLIFVNTDNVYLLDCLNKK